MASGKLMESWTFQRTLPEPFKDYTDNAVFKNIASKYCTQPQKRSTLHAATLQAVLTYMELEEPAGGKSAEELGAIGSQTNTYTVAEYPSRTGELHVVVYNPANGKFTRREVYGAAGYRKYTGKICIQRFREYRNCFVIRPDAYVSFRGGVQ